MPRFRFKVYQPASAGTMPSNRQTHFNQGLLFKTMAKLLFAEDDQEFASAMLDWFTLEKYAVEHVSTGSDAWEYMRSFGYDAVILDWEMPGMSGPEVCKLARQNGNDVPIIMLTGRKTTDDTLCGIDSGADDYLCKPVDPRLVLAKLKALLRRTEHRTDDTLKAQNVVLDPTKHTVTQDDRPLSLYPKEFALLEFMMRHPNRVFTSDELIASVWSADEEVTGESVRACVFRLRKKLNQPGKKSLIDNVYSVGYVLRD